MKTYICGCVRNCEPYLYTVFDNIQRIASLFDEYKIIIAYDDSNDNSLKILQEMKEKFVNMEILINDKVRLLHSRDRTINMANARNSIMKRMNELNDDYDYFIMMDMDDVCAKKMNIDVLKKYIGNPPNWDGGNPPNWDGGNPPNWDALSFNLKTYYDIWALSIHPYLVSTWHWIYESSSVTYETQQYVIKKLAQLGENELLDCHSAFNGFAIYKKNKFINCTYDANIFNNIKLLDTQLLIDNMKTIQNNFFINNKSMCDCEHRHFHFQAKQINNAQIKISPLCLFDE